MPYALGTYTHHGVPAFLGAIGLVALFADALCWGFVARGLVVSDPEAAQGVGVPVMFVLLFSSAAFVLVVTMPGWLQAIGAHQPVAALVDAERALLLGGPAAADVASTLAWSLGLLAGLVTLAVLAYRRTTR